jgi:archaetidylinositol phosphate synthase
MNTLSTDGHQAKRRLDFLLAPLERRTIAWSIKRLPDSIQPDHLTALGVAAALAFAACFAFSGEAPWLLWLGVGMLALNWFGDSLDGSLARARKIERPRYGYYLDHLVDAISTAAIAVGIGASPYMMLALGIGAGLVYMALSINVYLEAQTRGEFKIGYGIVGPTEARIALAAVTAALALGANVHLHLLGQTWQALDLVGVAMIVVMTLSLLVRAAGNLRALAALEPPAGRPAPGPA